jgi:hypothetical protein
MASEHPMMAQPAPGFPSPGVLSHPGTFFPVQLTQPADQFLRRRILVCAGLARGVPQFPIDSIALAARKEAHWLDRTILQCPANLVTKARPRAFLF